MSSIMITSVISYSRIGKVEEVIPRLIMAYAISNEVGGCIDFNNGVP